MGNKKKNHEEEYPVTKSYPYTRRASYFCKIDEVPQPPVSEHPKGWSPEQQRKLDELKLREAQQKERSDK